MIKFSVVCAAFTILMGLPAAHADEICGRLFGPDRAPAATASQAELEAYRSAARAVVNNIDRSFQSRYATTGYQNDAELRAHLQQAGPDVQKLLSMFDREAVDVVIHIPEAVRMSIAQNGIQNQHVTNTSSALYKGGGRVIAEARMAGMDLATYSALAGVVMPKYATLYPAPGEPLLPTIDTIDYGKDAYVLNLDHIRDRLTVTPGDSLNRLALEDPTGWDKVSTPISKWDEGFIPWKNRDLLIPILIVPTEQGRLESSTYLTNSGWTDEQTAALANYKIWNPMSGSSYLEAQVFGPIGLDDVKSFLFYGEPPSGTFLAILRSHGIEILDARGGKFVKWNG